MPVTTPDADIVATPVLLLLHVQPGVTEDKVVLEPTQVAGAPVITAGIVPTVTVTVL